MPEAWLALLSFGADKILQNWQLRPVRLPCSKVIIIDLGASRLDLPLISDTKKAGWKLTYGKKEHALDFKRPLVLSENNWLMASVLERWWTNG